MVTVNKKTATKQQNNDTDWMHNELPNSDSDCDIQIQGTSK